MKDLGTVNPGQTIYIEFDSFASSTGASITLTGLLASDVEVYKDGGTTQRASDNGYTLLDTDGIDVDGVTGIHGLSIDLADNTTAGFWAAGSHYRVVIASVTVDSQTVTFTAATFRIGYPAAILNTTIATLASQTSFTLTAGPAEDDALNGCMVLIHDVASAVQKGLAVVSDYTGATKTVTLAAGTTFTAAATDNVGMFPPANVTQWGGSATPVTNINTMFNTDYATLYDTTNKAFLSKLGNFAMGGSSLALTTGAISATTLATSGTTTLNALTVTNATTLSGAVSLGNTLAVTGTTTLAALTTTGTTTFNALTVTNGTTLSGAVSLGSTLGVIGTTTLAALTTTGTTTLNALTVTNATTLAAVNTGAIGATTLSTSGATTLNSLVVSTTTALTGAVTATNASNDIRGIALHATQAAYAPATAAAVAALNNLSASQVNAEVLDVMNVDTFAEPGQGAPAATTSIFAKINYLYKTWRNKKTQTATTRSLYADDGTTVDQKATDSDDATTFTKGEIASGP